MISYQTVIVGATLGFVVFMYNVTTMEGIFYRPDSSSGKKKFTMSIFKDYLKAPLMAGTPTFYNIWGTIPPNLKGVDSLSWRDWSKLIRLNWLAMVGAGTVGTCLIRSIL